MLVWDLSNGITNKTKIAYKNINIDGYDWCYITTDGITNINSYKTYEEAYEIGLQEALKQISNIWK